MMQQEGRNLPFHACRAMTNTPISALQPSCVNPSVLTGMDLHQGDCIQLVNSPDLFQVIGIDDCHNRCWVRRWPLQPAGGSKVFEISLGEIDLTDASDQHNEVQGASTGR